MKKRKIKAAARRMLPLWASTHTKIKKLAAMENRSLVRQVDVIVDEALRARNIEPATLRPISV